MKEVTFLPGWITANNMTKEELEELLTSWKKAKEGKGSFLFSQAIIITDLAGPQSELAALYNDYRWLPKATDQ